MTARGERLVVLGVILILAAWFLTAALPGSINDRVFGSYVEPASLPAGTPAPYGVPAAHSSGGATGRFTNALTAQVQTWKATAGTLYMLDLSNAGAGATVCYVQIFDNAAPVLGTTAPTFSFEILNGSVGRNIPVGTVGAGFSTAITAAATSTRTGGAPCGATVATNALVQ